LQQPERRGKANDSAADDYYVSLQFLSSKKLISPSAHNRLNPGLMVEIPADRFADANLN
jgi:hypothetical protein